MVLVPKNGPTYLGCHVAVHGDGLALGCAEPVQARGHVEAVLASFALEELDTASVIFCREVHSRQRECALQGLHRVKRNGESEEARVENCMPPEQSSSCALLSTAMDGRVVFL